MTNTTEDKASNEHPLFAALEAKRDVFRAVMGGTDGVRARGTSLLPKYPDESDSEYTARLNSSTIDGLVQGGVDQLAGQIFAGEIDTSDVAAKIVPFLDNIDNKGSDFELFAREGFKAGTEGFSLFLADIQSVSAADGGEEKAIGKRAYLNLYPAGCVINWRYAINPVSKQRELVLLVLREITSEPSGRFGVEMVTRYRVFELNGGVVTWELWREIKDATSKATKLVLEDSGVIEKVTGIPVGVNGELTDEPKLLKEARLEVKAYQKESSFDVIEYLSIPTFYTKGWDNPDGKTLSLGASSHIQLPIDGDVGYVQIDAQGHDSIKGTIREIKDYIKASVNYLITSATAQGEKTATEVVTDDRNEQARLVVWAKELEAGLNEALKFMGQLQGLGDDAAGSIKLTPAWEQAKSMFTPEDMRVEGELVSEGLASVESFVQKRFTAGLLPEGVTVEQELERIKGDEEERAAIMPVMNAKLMPNGEGLPNEKSEDGDEDEETQSVKKLPNG